MFVKHCNQYSYANNFQFCSTCSNNHKIITSCFISTGIQVDAERKILYTHIDFMTLELLSMEVHP